MAHNSYCTAYLRMHMGMGRINEKQVNYIFAFFVRFYINNLDKL